MSTHADAPVNAEVDVEVAEEYHEEHSDIFYVKIAAILALITGLEVSLTYVDVGPIFLPALLILMSIKFIMVVLFFMHLRFDNRIFSMLFYAGLTLAIFVYIGALATFKFFLQP